MSPHYNLSECSKCSGKGGFDTFGKPCDGTLLSISLILEYATLYKTQCTACNGKCYV